MTATTDADRLVIAWLASDGVADIRPDVVDRALDVARAKRPRHGLMATLRGPRPWPRSGGRATTTTILVLVGLILAVILAATAASVGGLGPRLDVGPLGGVTRPLASDSSVGSVPAALQGRWVAEPRLVPGHGTSTRTALELSADAFALTGDRYGAGGILHAKAVITAGSGLRLTSTSGDECRPSDVGTYRRTLSPGGTVLSVSLVQDACAARAAAVPGTWYRVACKDPTDDCLGVLESGTYPSQFIAPRLSDTDTWEPDFGAVTYTVPAGWANSADWPNILVLTPAADYALEGPKGPPNEDYHELDLYAQPYAALQDGSCSGEPDLTVDRSVDGLIEWLRSVPSLSVSAPMPVTIGGRVGKTVKIELAPSWTGRCPGGTVPGSTILAQGPQMDPRHGWGVTIADQEQVRLDLLDLGDGDLLAVIVDSRDPTRFADLVFAASPIIAGLHIR